MTFLHKLARRLARLKPRSPVAVAAVSAAAAFVAASYPSQNPSRRSVGWSSLPRPSP